MVKSFEVRKVDRSNVDDFVQMIRELARFEDDTPPDEAAKRRLIADALSEDSPFNAVLAYLGDKPVGYAMYYTTYSSFDGRRILFLEDIIVHEEERKAGLGDILFKFCLKEAKRLGCCCMEWMVRDWNVGAMSFYERMGGKRTNCLVYEIDEKDF